MLHRSALLGAAVVAVLLACGIAYAAKSYPDRPGDVAAGTAPDIVSIRVSNTRASIGFEIRFTTAPPLRLSERGKWVDMLLVGIDVPPLGALPSRPGGEWPGANFALGTHGPSTTGQIVRLGTSAAGRRVGTFRIVTSGHVMRFSIPRRLLGSPKWFTFSVAAARETETPTGGGFDVVPDRGTFRYRLT